MSVECAVCGKKTLKAALEEKIAKRYQKEFEKWRMALEEKSNENEIIEDIQQISLFTIIKDNLPFI